MGFTLKIINYPANAIAWGIHGYADGNWITWEQNAGSTEHPWNFRFNIGRIWKARYDIFENGGIVVVSETDLLLGVSSGLATMISGKNYEFDCITLGIREVKVSPFKPIVIGVGIALGILLSLLRNSNSCWRGGRIGVWVLRNSQHNGSGLHLLLGGWLL